MNPYEPTDAEHGFAEATSWMVDAARSTQHPRPELTGHLFRSPDQTLCGLAIAAVNTVPATEDDVPCRECVDVADPAGAAALVDDEVPL